MNGSEEHEAPAPGAPTVHAGLLTGLSGRLFPKMHFKKGKINHYWSEISNGPFNVEKAPRDRLTPGSTELHSV